MRAKFSKTILTVIAAVAALLASGGFVLASAASSSGPTYRGCVEGTSRFLEDVHVNAPVTCPKGTIAVTWNQQGPQGVQGVPGPQGPPGPATLTVSANTTFTNWTESSGWATDQFTRDATVTREYAVPADKCGATATQCWFYTGSYVDNGTMTTVSGHASPNGSSTTTIGGAWTGTMNGTARIEFYAGSDTPNPSIVPGTIDGSQKGGKNTTSTWFENFFPNGTPFGATSGVTAPFTTYDWVYLITVPCGTNNNTTQTWNDGINPGDDGQGSTAPPPAGDGNITGTNGC